MTVEALNDENLSDAAKIEALCFAEPWSEKSLHLLLDTGVGFIVRDDGGEAAAYCGMLCIAGEGQITDVATLPEYRRRGYASALIEAIIEEACSRGLFEVTLEVRESNIAAMALYAKHGFAEIGRRRGYYRFPTEAAVIMKLIPDVGTITEKKGQNQC